MIERVLPLAREQPLFDAAQTKLIEQHAAASQPAHALMQRAGASCARLALALAPHAHRFWIAAGPGNNGGDGLEAAIHLTAAGKLVQVSLMGDAATMPADALAALARAQAAGVPIASGAVAMPGQPQFAIDALLGAGANRAPQGAIAAAIASLNALPCPVLAVDLPSGLSPDTGQPPGDACVTAAHTLALLTLKPGLFTGSGRDHAGEVWLDTLGVDGSIVSPHAWLSGSGTCGAVAVRRHAQHKGSFGDVAVVGGALGMTGAALLAARAALAAGSGRVYLELLATASDQRVDLLRPELMFRAGWSRGTPETLADTTVVCGCGGGDAVRTVLPRLLGLAGRLVLDADALNAIAADAGLAAQLRARATRGQATVLTPHPLEASRLLGASTGEVQAGRLRAASDLVQRFGCVVVLKGSGTVIAAPGRLPRINASGNAALATAGTGDVLAGWLGGRWAQRPSEDAASRAFASALQAVAEHGAGAEPQPAGSMRASDLIERLHSR